MANVNLTLTNLTIAQAQGVLAAAAAHDVPVAMSVPEAHAAVAPTPAPVQPEPEVEEVRPVTRTDLILAELNGQYALRSYKELTAKYHVSRDTIDNLLNVAGVEFVNKTRRSDGALLIGLASRN